MPDLTEGEKGLMSWQYPGTKWDRGGFAKALWNAIMVADDKNLGRIAEGFPEEVEAFKRFRFEEGYWDDVRRLAGVELD